MEVSREPIIWRFAGFLSYALQFRLQVFLATEREPCFPTTLLLLWWPFLQRITRLHRDTLIQKQATIRLPETPSVVLALLSLVQPTLFYESSFRISPLGKKSIRLFPVSNMPCFTSPQQPQGACHFAP